MEWSIEKNPPKVYKLVLQCNNTYKDMCHWSHTTTLTEEEFKEYLYKLDAFDKWLGYNTIILPHTIKRLEANEREIMEA